MSLGQPVLVTGAAGFIGSHLARRLAESGNAVRGMDIQSAPPPITAAGVAFHQGDIRDLDLLTRLVRGTAIVYHLASVHLNVHSSEQNFVAVNVEAAKMLVRVCKEAGVRRLVHTSSVGIYGHVASPPANEDSPKHPDTPYERTKLAGEKAVLREAQVVGLDTIVLRPAWVYGVGCPRTAKLMRALEKGRFFYVGSGSNLRHPIYIDDMLAAFKLAAIADPQLSGRAYIIAGPRAMKLDEMVSTFATATGTSVPKVHMPRPVAWTLAWASELASGLLRREPPFSRRSLAFFQNDNAFDTSAAARDLGFQAAVDLPEGVRLTLEQTQRTVT